MKKRKKKQWKYPKYTYILHTKINSVYRTRTRTIKSLDESTVHTELAPRDLSLPLSLFFSLEKQLIADSREKTRRGFGIHSFIENFTQKKKKNSRVPTSRPLFFFLGCVWHEALLLCRSLAPLGVWLERNVYNVTCMYPCNSAFAIVDFSAGAI